MPKTETFELHHQRYENWFGEHEAAFISELLALRPFVPYEGLGIEIGVGSGRFASPLGVQVGIDPSSAMLSHAYDRGIQVARGAAENLPFSANSFDHALVVTTICFVDSPTGMLKEAWRVLKNHGHLVLGFVDKTSLLGHDYLRHQSESVFYENATFFSSDEVEQLLKATGFLIEAWVQTLSKPLPEISQIESLRPGRNECSFVVVKATKFGGDCS